VAQPDAFDRDCLQLDPLQRTQLGQDNVWMDHENVVLGKKLLPTKPLPL
jgi:hypothetical protein